MNRKELKKNKIIKILMSYKLTILGLAWLFVLTIWGTVYQIEHGLYKAQAEIFNSWFLGVGGIPIFPGARLVLWILCFNLFSAAIFKFQYNLKKLGIITIHFGMFVLLFSSWLTLHYAVESYLNLEEGQGNNTTADYHLWELSVWQQNVSEDTLTRDVEAHAIDGVNKGQQLVFEKEKFKVNVIDYFTNANARTGVSRIGKGELRPININGIWKLEPAIPSDEPERNFPGIDFIIETESSTEKKRVILAGQEAKATPVEVNGKVLFFSLRHRRYETPIFLSLIDFKKEEHPGTQIAKSYASLVSMNAGKSSRELTISMNQPLRVKDYTFYQASFSQSQQGETSTLAVVKHPGRLLPYIGSIIIGLGLIYHFFVMLIKFAMRKNSN